MRLTLAVVLFGISTMFVSFSSFGVHLDVYYKTEAEAYASPSWNCDYHGALPAHGYWGFYGISLQGSLGSAMDVEGCLAAAQSKVVEMSAAWLAEMAKINAVYGLGPGSCSAPVRELECFKGPLTQVPDPVTGAPIDAHAYNCNGRYYANCTLIYQGTVIANSQQYAGLGPVAGHPYGEGWASYGGGIYILANGCTVDPLPAYTPDPYPALIEELSPRMQTALSCLRAAIGGQGGSSSFTSGYRPALYNAHLIAVWDKLQELNNYKGTADCSARRAEVMAEIALHKMKVRPDPNSPHTIREAFDLSSSLSRDVINGLAINCGAFAPYPLSDRPHFEPVR